MRFWRQEKLRKPLILSSILLIIMFIHVFLVSLFLQDYNNLPANRISDRHTYVILDYFINTYKNLSTTQIQSYINGLANSTIEVNKYSVDLSLSAKPLWPIQLNAQNWNEFEKKLSHVNVYSIGFSYQLNNQLWLNYHAHISYTFFIVTAFLLVSEIILLCAIIFYFWSIAQFTIPLKKFKLSADTLGLDLNVTPLIPQGPRIVQETTQAINNMQVRIQELMNNRTQLFAAISHDLRTPISRLKLRAQLLDDDLSVQKITHDLEEMENLIDGFLNYSRDNKTTEQKIKLDLNSLLESVCEDFSELGYAVNFSTDVGRVSILGRPNGLKRAFNNLINNALKYGQECRVMSSLSGEYFKMTFTDAGLGIPEAELSKVILPFYRSKARSAKKSTGTGLGLTIVNEIIQAHGGSITLENISPHGLCVILLLPLGLK